MESEQNEYRRIGWSMVRILKNMDLVVVEESLKSVLKKFEAPIWAYHAAKDYAEHYLTPYGSGLIPNSASTVEEIAGFWRKHYGIKERESRPPIERADTRTTAQ
jgi:hypothetical protein